MEGPQGGQKTAGSCSAGSEVSRNFNRDFLNGQGGFLTSLRHLTPLPLSPKKMAKRKSVQFKVIRSEPNFLLKFPKLAEPNFLKVRSSLLLGSNAKSVTELVSCSINVMFVVWSDVAEQLFGPYRHQGLGVTATSVPPIAMSLSLSPLCCQTPDPTI